MFQQSQSRLNQMAFVGYYLDTRVGAWTHLRVDSPDVSKRRADMDVSGMGSVYGSGPVRSTPPAASSGATNAASSNAASPADKPAIASPQDELEISEAGKMLERLSESPEARAERLAQIKLAIENGDYDSDAKLEAALERMFEVHGIDLNDE